jgi:HEAT repeat protein
MRTALLLLLGIASASASAPCASAQADALLAELGDPPRLETVRRLVRTVGLDPEQERAFAEGLAIRGGHAAAQGLYDLAGESDPCVRIAALDGIAEVALRRAEGIESVRTALLASDADVRAAAFCAIARVGDASDVQSLLDALSSDDERTRAAADRALTTLTGISFSSDGPEGWRAWWRESRVILPRRLAAAVYRIDRGGERADLRDARLCLAQLAWFDVSGVQERARGWLHSIDARRRAEGYRAAAQCRLGDLADDVRGSAREELDPDLIFVSLCSAKVLGVEVDGFTLPAAIPDVLALLAEEQEQASSELADRADLERVVLERLRLEEERLASLSTRSSGGATHAGAPGGAVWLDLDAKRKRARSAASAAAAAGAPASALRFGSPSGWSFTWIGYPLVAVAIGLGFLIALRRQGRPDAKDAKPTWSDVPLAEDGAGSRGSGAHLEAPLVAELRRVAINPGSLAVAEVKPGAVGAVVHAANRWLEQNFERMRSLESRVLVARARRDELQRLVQCELARPDEFAELEQAVARCVALEPELAAADQELFDAATATLSNESKATLGRIRANQARGALPAEYLVVERSDEDRVRLDEALRAEAEVKRRKRKKLEPGLSNRLKRARSDLAVWHAHVNRDERIEEVTAAWERAIAAADAQQRRVEAPVEVESCESSPTAV